MRNLARYFVLLSLWLIGGNGSFASTAWQEIGSVIGPEGFLIYVDETTLPSEHIVVVSVTHVRQYHTFQLHVKTGRYIHSQTIQAEYDCHLEQERIQASTWYEGPMGTGEVVETELGDGQWHPLKPGSVSAVVWKTACH